jgi:hypothetical protein
MTNVGFDSGALGFALDDGMALYLVQPGFELAQKISLANKPG